MEKTFIDLILYLFLYFHLQFYLSIYLTRVCGVTHSVSARRWEGGGIDAWPKRVIVKYVKILYLLLRSHIGNIYSMSRGKGLAINSVPCTVRTSR